MVVCVMRLLGHLKMAEIVAWEMWKGMNYQIGFFLKNILIKICFLKKMFF